MPDLLRAALKDMDDWMEARGTDRLRVVTEADVIGWRTALATALERLDKVERASLSAVEAYLLRPPASGLPSTPPTRSTTDARRRHWARLASAMATLERELAAGRGVEATSHRFKPPVDSAS